MPLTYMQCRDTKCTPNKVMEKERAVYMQTLKRKCSQTYSACAAKHYNGVAFKTDGRQTGQVLKKELRSLVSVWGEEAHHAKEIQTG